MTTTSINVVSVQQLIPDDDPEMRDPMYPVPDSSNLWVEEDMVVDYYHNHFREDYNMRNQPIIHWSCLDRAQQEEFGKTFAGIALKYAMGIMPDMHQDDMPSIDPTPYMHDGNPFSIANHVRERLETLTQEQRAGQYDDIVRQLSDQFEAPNSLFVATLTEVDGGTKFTGPSDGEFTLLRTGEIQQG